MDQTTKYSLLDDDIFTLVKEGDRLSLTLPGLLQALGHGGFLSFAALRPHQQHAWHAFTVQLAAMALHRAGESSPTQPQKRWRELLLAMTDGMTEPWCLIVEDLGKPAFMQPPVPENKIDKKWKVVATPGALDLLVTAKNHDVKGQLIERPAPEHWVYALVSLQTMEGFLGAGNYGIARMNGGFASRPCVAFAPVDDARSRFARDAQKVLAGRGTLVSPPWPYAARGGLGLLWCEPWDGKSALSLDKLDPFFIEICRRVRLEMQHGQARARAISTKSARVAAKEIKGVTGDPWTPVDVKGKEAKALTISASGFDYKQLHKLLLGGDYQHGLAGQRADDEKGELCLIAQAMTRGQGKTEGLHQRQLRLPAPFVGMLAAGNRDAVAERSQQRIADAETVRRKVLHLALCQITQGAPDGKPDFRDDKDQKWQDNFEREVDAIFFERLFSQLDLDDDEASEAWARELIDLARAQLDDCLRSTPQPSLRRYRVEAKARAVFEGCARKNFADVFYNSSSASTKTQQQGGSHV